MNDEDLKSDNKLGGLDDLSQDENSEYLVELGTNIKGLNNKLNTMEAIGRKFQNIR
jgi:hypothetical protein